MNSAIHKSSYNNLSSIMLHWLMPMPSRLTENMTGMEWLDQNMTVTWSIDPRILSSEIIRAAIFSACQESKFHYEGYVSHPCHKNPSCILKPKLNFQYCSAYCLTYASMWYNSKNKTWWHSQLLSLILYCITCPTFWGPMPSNAPNSSKLHNKEHTQT
jgi:hypothetical protein